MAPQEYSWEVRERAKELYVVDGLTFLQVAQETGVSESQLKRWSAEEKEWAAGRAKSQEEKDKARTGPRPARNFAWPWG